MKTTTTKTPTAAQNIRRALKSELGLTSKHVSVKTSKSCWSESVTVTIKRSDVDAAAVTQVAKRFEELRRDALTGEVLQGCNLWVHVRNV